MLPSRTKGVEDSMLTASAVVSSLLSMQAAGIELVSSQHEYANIVEFNLQTIRDSNCPASILLDTTGADIQTFVGTCCRSVQTSYFPSQEDNTFRYKVVRGQERNGSVIPGRDANEPSKLQTTAVMIKNAKGNASRVNKILEFLESMYKLEPELSFFFAEIFDNIYHSICFVQAHSILLQTPLQLNKDPNLNLRIPNTVGNGNLGTTIYAVNDQTEDLALSDPQDRDLLAWVAENAGAIGRMYEVHRQHGSCRAKTHNDRKYKIPDPGYLTESLIARERYLCRLYKLELASATAARKSTSAQLSEFSSFLNSMEPGSMTPENLSRFMIQVTLYVDAGIKAIIEDIENLFGITHTTHKVTPEFLSKYISCFYVEAAGRAQKIRSSTVASEYVSLLEQIASQKLSKHGSTSVTVDYKSVTPIELIKAIFFCDRPNFISQTYCYIWHKMCFVWLETGFKHYTENSAPAIVDGTTMSYIPVGNMDLSIIGNLGCLIEYKCTLANKSAGTTVEVERGRAIVIDYLLSGDRVLDISMPRDFLRVVVLEAFMLKLNRDNASYSDRLRLLGELNAFIDSFLSVIYNPKNLSLTSIE